MVLQEQVVKQAKIREDIEHKEASPDAVGLSAAENNFIKEHKLANFVGRPVTTVCIPPSIKKQFIDDLSNRTKSAKGDLLKFDKAGETGTNTFKAQQSVVKRINTFSVLVNKVPTCTPDQMEKVIDDVTKQFDGDTFDEKIETIIGKIGKEKAKEKAFKKINTTSGREAYVQKKFKLADEKGLDYRELTEAQKVPIDAAALEEIAEEIQDKEEDRLIATSEKKTSLQWRNSYELIDKIHEKTGRELLNFVKGKTNVEKGTFSGDRGSATSDKPYENILSSPCGLRINMGFNRDGLQVAQDKLAFMGSAEDWHDYYVGSISLSKINRGAKGHITFMKMHPNDWGGCVKDIYEGEEDITYDQFVNRVGKADFVIPEQFFDNSRATVSRKKVGTVVEDGKEKGIYAIVGYQDGK